MMIAFEGHAKQTPNQRKVGARAVKREKITWANNVMDGLCDIFPRPRFLTRCMSSYPHNPNLNARQRAKAERAFRRCF